MATTRTVTVKSSGGDYTSVATALSTETKDLVANDRVLVIEVYANAGTQNPIDITGWTTDATRYLQIIAPVGERHAGAWDAAKSYFSAGFSTTIRVQANQFIKLEYLQTQHLRTGSFTGAGIEVYGTAGGQIEIVAPICKWTDNGGSGSGPKGIYLNSSAAFDVTILRPLIIDFPEGIRQSGYGTGARSLLIYNPTIVGHSVTGIKVEDMGGSSFTLRIKNALIQGTGTGYVDAESGAVKSLVSILTQDTSSPTVGLRSKTVTFVGGSNYTPDATDTAARDAGTDLSADSYLPHSVDLAGNTITGTWDVGALEYIVPAAGAARALVNGATLTSLVNGGLVS